MYAYCDMSYKCVNVVIIFHLFFHFTTNLIDGMPAKEDNKQYSSKEMDDNETLNEIFVEAVHKIIDQTISHLLVEEKSGPSKFDSSILEKIQKELRSQSTYLSFPTLKPSLSLEASVLKIIEESVERNLKEATLLYSKAKANNHERDLLSAISDRTSETNSIASMLDGQTKEKQVIPKISRNDEANYRENEKRNINKETQSSSADSENFSSETPAPITMLLEPSFEKISVIDELETLGIEAENFGIQSISSFSSGGVLIKFNSTYGREEMRKTVQEKSTRICIQEQKPNFIRSPTVRIQNLSFAVTDEQVWRSISDQFHETPLRISLISCEDPMKAHLIRTVLLRVTNTLLEKMKALPYLTIDGYQYFINTSLFVPRCFKCKLIGHSFRTCKFSSRPYPTNMEACIDCCFYNAQILNSKNSNRPLRAVSHSTNHESCLTKKFYESQWLSRMTGSQLGVEFKEKPQVFEIGRERLDEEVLENIAIEQYVQEISDNTTIKQGIKSESNNKIIPERSISDENKCDKNLTDSIQKESVDEVEGKLVDDVGDSTDQRELFRKVKSTIEEQVIQRDTNNSVQKKTTIRESSDSVCQNIQKETENVSEEHSNDVRVNVEEISNTKKSNNGLGIVQEEFENKIEEHFLVGTSINKIKVITQEPIQERQKPVHVPVSKIYYLLEEPED